jgi:hypothetical protein
MLGMVSGLGILFELVLCVLAFELVLTCGVIYYILLYNILLYIYYYYTYTIYYIILFSSSLPLFILFSSYSSSSSSLPSLLSSSSSILYLLFCLYSSLLILPSSSLPNHTHSFYTCRYLHILIYILSLKNNLTPHKLSEGCLEWCSFICVVFGLRLRCVGLMSIDLSCWCYIINYTLLSYTILSSPYLLFQSTRLSPNHLSVFSHPLILPNIHSILVGTYIYLFIFFFKNNLTPHKLSEWMVEVCGKYLCWDGF